MRKLLFIIVLLFNFIVKNTDTECGKRNLTKRYLGGNENSLVSKDTKDEFGDRGYYSDYCNFYQYFTNLTTNFGNNAETYATCGYVALAMLLTYYDSYLMDSVVSESFEQYGNSSISPGTLYEATSSCPNNDVAGYYNYLRTNYINSSLHAYLILLDKGALTSNPANMASTYLGEFGTNEFILSSLASTYLSIKNISTCTVVSNSSVNAGETFYTIADEIVDEIENGYPVLVGYGGHARVVYGFQHSTERFISHEGYLGMNEEYSESLDFLYTELDALSSPDIGYVSLHFTNTHSHAYNYYDSSINQYYCSCGTYQHTHSYTDHFVNLNANRHKAYCSCGDFIYEQHDYLINLFDNPCRCGRSI